MIVAFMTASHEDIDCLMTLSHRNLHHGSQYFLRVLFERVVTLKYLLQYPEKLEDFVNYDAVDWEQILKGINHLTGLSLDDTARVNISTRAKAARSKNKQEKCSACGNQRPASWTLLNTKSMADSVGMDHLYLNCFTFPSKLMHPTLWGTRERVNPNNPMYNTLNSLHHLLVELILAHRRYFANRYLVTPMGIAVIRDFLKVWTISETSFGGLLTLRREGNGLPIFYG
jgi:hypothetical protein